VADHGRHDPRGKVEGQVHKTRGQAAPERVPLLRHGQSRDQNEGHGKAILKQLPITPMSVVKSNNITRQEASHESGHWLRSRTEKKVGIIGHKNPRITGCPCLGTKNRKPSNEVIAIFIIAENVPAFYFSNHYMV
jgi:hypothetical protein